MKATESSVGVIGIALDDFDSGFGQIMVLVRTGATLTNQVPSIQGNDQLTIDMETVLSGTSQLDTLQVKDTLITRKLVVEQAAQFNGTILVKGEAGFEKLVTFKDGIKITGHIEVYSDTAGTATIPANATSTDVVFTKPYQSIPVITANISSTDSDNLVFVNWLVSNKSKNGFRINIATTTDSVLSFDWIALAVSDSNQPLTANTIPDINTEETSNEILDETASSGENHTPIIQDVTIQPEFNMSGEPVKLQVLATDSDSDQLTYTWIDGNQGGAFRAEGGTSYFIDKFTGDDSLVYYTYDLKEDQTEAYIPITIIVSDGNNESYLNYELHIHSRSPLANQPAEELTDNADDQPPTEQETAAVVEPIEPEVVETQQPADNLTQETDSQDQLEEEAARAPPTEEENLEISTTNNSS